VAEGAARCLVEAGAGLPVVLLHGANGTLQDFTSTIFDELARSHRVIAIDRPGHGYSERPVGVVATPDVQARLVRAALRELGVERPLLVAFSWSGSLALAYALAYPDDVAAIAMIAGAAYEWPAPVDLKWRMPTWPVVGELLVNTLPLVVAQFTLAGSVRDAFAPEPVASEEMTSLLPRKTAVAPVSWVLMLLVTNA